MEVRVKVTAKKKSALAAIAAATAATALVSTSATAAGTQDQPEAPSSQAQTSTAVPAEVAAVPAALTATELAATKKAQRFARVQALRAKLVKIARKQVGDSYSSGGTGPNSFDCSGFTQYVYRTAGGKYLPHQSYAQYRKAKKISLKNARPGDLVFYFKGGVHHVGLYIGHKTMIHAANSHTGVRKNKIFGAWYSSHFSGIGRVLPA